MRWAETVSWFVCVSGAKHSGGALGALVQWCGLWGLSGCWGTITTENGGDWRVWLLRSMSPSEKQGLKGHHHPLFTD